MKAGTGQGENLAGAPQQTTCEKMKKKKIMKRMRMQVQAQAQQQPSEQL